MDQNTKLRDDMTTAFQTQTQTQTLSNQRASTSNLKLPTEKEVVLLRGAHPLSRLKLKTS
eukprot:scaffold1049_cov79-Skeletonema_marinoi.AAC.1